MPFLRKNLKISKAKIKKSVLLTTDISESEIEQKIKDIYEPAKKINVSIGITAVPGIIKVLIISSASSEEKNLKNIKNPIEKMLYERIGQYHLW
jgi:molybdopterin-biosynthesis enzyme MoeA-like protein